MHMYVCRGQSYKVKYQLVKFMELLNWFNILVDRYLLRIHSMVTHTYTCTI